MIERGQSGRRMRVDMFVVAIVALLALPSPSASQGQRGRIMTPEQLEAAAKKYKAGQLIEVKSFGKWIAAEVTSTEDVWIHVKLINPDGSDGDDYSTTARDVRALPADRAAKIKKARQAAAAGAAADGQPAQGEGGGAKAGGPYAPPAMKLTPADWKSARVLTLPKEVPWTYKPIPVPKIKLSAQPISLPTPYLKAETTEQSYAIPKEILPLGSPDGKQARVVWKESTSTNHHRLQIIDVTTGKALTVSPLFNNPVLVDVSPSGKRLLVRTEREFQGAGTGALHVFDITGPNSPPKHVVSFAPYGVEPHDGNPIGFGLAAFVDDQHVIVVRDGQVGVNQKNLDFRMALWALDGVKAQYSIDLGADGGMKLAPALDATRTVVALPHADGPILLEAKTGKVLGRCKGTKVEAPTFDATGLRLCGTSGVSHTYLWDLSTGKTVVDANTGGLYAARALEGDYALLGGKDLVDLKLGLVTWGYELENYTSAWGPFIGGRLSLITRNGRNGPYLLSFHALPHAAAKAHGEKVAGGVGESLFTPGMKVSIETDIAGAPADTPQRAVKHVTEQLTKLGFTVSPEPQTMKVILRSKAGESKQLKFGRNALDAALAGADRGDAITLTVNEVEHSVLYELDGKVVWAKSSAFRDPGMLRVEQGKNPQEAVDRKREESYQFYDHVALTNKFYKEKKQALPGKSDMTANGPKDRPLPKLPLAEPAPAPAPAPVPKEPVKPKPAPATTGDGLD